MIEMIEITLAEAQKFILEKQGLITKTPVQSTLEAANRIHNIQIDTISVVARAHDLTVFSRFPNYQEKDVWNLLEQKKLFESISHSLCLLPIEEFSYYYWQMMEYRNGLNNSYWSNWIRDNQPVIDKVYDTIKEHGARSSKDFKVPPERKSKGWWEWKSEKRALEYLFRIGKLLIHYRKGFQKYYDLPERVLPNTVDIEPMPAKEVPDYICEKTFASYGIGNHQEIRGYINNRVTQQLWKNQQKPITNYLDEKVKDNFLTKVKIKTIKEPHYVRTQDVNLLQNNDVVKRIDELHMI